MRANHSAATLMADRSSSCILLRRRVMSIIITLSPPVTKSIISPVVLGTYENCYCLKTSVSAHVLYWLPYLFGKGNNSLYEVFEPKNCKINNNHLSITLLLRVSTSTRASSGRYVQGHISTANLSRIFLCRFKIFCTCVHLFIPP